MIFLALAVAAAPALAHPGGVDARGGHVCRTDCEEYGLLPGEYHRHKPGSHEPIREPGFSGRKDQGGAGPAPTGDQIAGPGQVRDRKASPGPETSPGPAAGPGPARVLGWLLAVFGAAAGLAALGAFLLLRAVWRRSVGRLRLRRAGIENARKKEKT